MAPTAPVRATPGARKLLARGAATTSTPPVNWLTAGRVGAGAAADLRASLPTTSLHLPSPNSASHPVLICPSFLPPAPHPLPLAGPAHAPLCRPVRLVLGVCRRRRRGLQPAHLQPLRPPVPQGRVCAAHHVGAAQGAEDRAAPLPCLPAANAGTGLTPPPSSSPCARRDCTAHSFNYTSPSCAGGSVPDAFTLASQRGLAADTSKRCCLQWAGWSWRLPA